MSQLSSYLTATLGLLVLFLASAVLTATRPHLNPRIRASRRFLVIVTLTILAQSVHFIEELQSGFFVRFPETLGLQPWSETFFVSFNVTWLGLWILSLVAVRAGLIVAVCPLWFLALATLLNMLAHPILALRVGGYFPGLLTAPLVGIAGVFLIRELVKVTTPGEAVPRHP